MLAKVAAGYGGVAKKAPLPEAMQRQMDKRPLEKPLKQAASCPCHGQTAQRRTQSDLAGRMSGQKLKTASYAGETQYIARPDRASASGTKPWSSQ